MNLNQVKNYTKGVLQGWFLNKPALDKISESNDGKILYNNKELDVTEQVASIKKYQKYLNTELDYCYAYTTYTNNLSYTSSSVPFVIPFESYDSNMSINNTEHSILLKANKKYNVQYSSRIGGSTNIQAGFSIYDEHDNELIKTWAIDATGTLDNTWDGKCINAILCVTEDTKIFVKCSTITGTINSLQCDLSIAEVNRQITIDPLEHANESQGLEDTPVGHIISHMGTIAPKHYLICDGTEYNISDYPYLAQHIIDNFGSVNYFGGDGATTFAVPDLRGEFLRGTGTATRNTGSGEEVGKHQDGTEHADTLTNSQYSIAAPRRIWGYGANRDSIVNSIETYNATTNIVTNTLSGGGTFTSRPTNTSVLYCIKYEPTYFMQVNNLLIGKREIILWEGNQEVVCTLSGTTYDIDLALSESVKNFSEIEVEYNINIVATTSTMFPETKKFVVPMEIDYTNNSNFPFLTITYAKYINTTIAYLSSDTNLKIRWGVTNRTDKDMPMYITKITGINYAELSEDTVLTQEQIQAAIDEDVF